MSPDQRWNSATEWAEAGPDSISNPAKAPIHFIVLSKARLEYDQEERVLQLRL
jgi:hypothetical protein